ncbi:MAG TPA: nitrophenyl compound nitroreductase subunit ArsF family protein [Bacteroidales bacterium]
MKTLQSLLLPLILLFAFPQLNAQTATGVQTPVKVSETTEVFYFHFSRRCATCEAVEKVTEETLKKNYPEQLKNETLVFVSVNLDDEVNATLAEQLKVTGQTLLFVKGNNKKDLTNKAFMYARENPDKLEAAIKETISSL